MTDREILPTYVKPTHYTVSVYGIDEEKFTYQGTTKIDLEVREATDEIKLNYRYLTIEQAFLAVEVTKTTYDITSSAIEYDEAVQVVTFKLPQTLPVEASKATLTVIYSGVLNDAMCGFYRSKYTSAEGKPTHMYSTQFESSDARRAFPCFDEPALKATFDFSITVPETWTALSNMPEVSSKPPEDGKKKGVAPTALKTVTFATTPVMSTYLLAWACGDFEYVEGETARLYHGKPLPVKVYTTKGLKQQGEFALSCATKVIDYFSEVFDIDYVLPKLDMIACHEFSHGAMENWGLITYRTTAVLFDEATSDSSYKKRVAYVVAHELAHQWFGNLVTMDWWNELWLNEGFATFAGWLAVDKLFPEWDVFSSFVSESLQDGLALDSLRQSHPIEVPVRSVLDVEQIFDAISYLKGASSIRMISSHLGQETFLKGVSKYLKAHAYGNAHTSDLWDAISEEAGVNVGAMMENWIKKIGYPLLTVTETDAGVSIAQRRFLLTGDVGPEDDTTTWWVPLGIVSGAEAAVFESVSAFEAKDVTVAGLDLDFYKINKNQTGVYRVNYPPARLAKLGQQVDRLSSTDKVGLIADSFHIANACEGSTVGFLSLLEGFRHEESYVVWSQIASRLASLRSAFFEQPTAVRDGLAKFTRDLLKPTFERLGYEFVDGEDYLTARLRALMFEVLGAVRDPDVVAYFQTKFASYAAGDKKALGPNIRSAVFGAVLSDKDCTDASYEAILGELDNPSSVDAKEVTIRSLGKVRRPELVKRSMALILSDKIPTQDLYNMAVSFGGNGDLRWQFWEYVKSDWANLSARLKTNVTIQDHFVRLTIYSFSSQKAYDDITAFFKDKDTREFARSLGQALDKIKAASSWVAKDGADVAAWLKEHGYSE
ncbi:peptidase family M1-domain-containing protein [Dipodascopsis tothii]|uniref:peptidase family M1-domain-containing protein n=1 Tax=Dipodascopsis tothii TaxID=44089 RepID=UPI0034CE4A69